MRLTPCKAPTRETRPDRFTGNSVSYSLRQVRGFFNVPTLKMQQTGPTCLSSLSEKTHASNHLQMSLQRQQALLSYFKTVTVGPVWGSNPRPPLQQSMQHSANRSAGNELQETRNCNLKKLKLTSIKQSYGQRSFIFGAASLWNRLPAESRNCSL